MGTILWENPSPTVNFAEQTIILPSNDYDFLEIYASINTTSTMELCFKFTKGHGTLMSFGTYGSNGAQATTSRRVVEYVSETQYKISSGQRTSGTGSISTDNTILIPRKIVGYKS